MEFPLVTITVPLLRYCCPPMPLLNQKNIFQASFHTLESASQVPENEKRWCFQSNWYGWAHGETSNDANFKLVFDWNFSIEPKQKEYVGSFWVKIKTIGI